MLYFAITLFLTLIAGRAAHGALYADSVEEPPNGGETTMTAFEITKWRSTFRWELYDLKEEIARELITYRHREASTVLSGAPPRIVSSEVSFAAFGSMHPTQLNGA